MVAFIKVDELDKISKENTIILDIGTNEEFAKRYYSLYQDFQVILPFEKKFLKKANLDLMFIMDCTGSMSSWISKCQEELLNIINNIKESYPDSYHRPVQCDPNRSSLQQDNHHIHF